MLAASSSFLHRNPNPPLADPTKSARTCRPSPTKFRRQSLPNRGAYLGRWTALRLDEQQQRGQTKQKPQEQEQHLSGADVLRALQRASAQKIKKNHTRRRERVVADKARRGGEREEGVDAAGKNESSVRALCINGEWGARLDDLEKQLRDLMHS